MAILTPIWRDVRAGDLKAAAFLHRVLSRSNAHDELWELADILLEQEQPCRLWSPEDGAGISRRLHRFRAAARTVPVTIAGLPFEGWWLLQSCTPLVAPLRRRLVWVLRDTDILADDDCWPVKDLYLRRYHRQIAAECRARQEWAQYHAAAGFYWLMQMYHCGAQAAGEGPQGSGVVFRGYARLAKSAALQLVSRYIQATKQLAPSRAERGEYWRAAASFAEQCIVRSLLWHDETRTFERAHQFSPGGPAESAIGVALDIAEYASRVHAATTERTS